MKRNAKMLKYFPVSAHHYTATYYLANDCSALHHRETFQHFCVSLHQNVVTGSRVQFITRIPLTQWGKSVNTCILFILFARLKSCHFKGSNVATNIKNAPYVKYSTGSTADRSHERLCAWTASWSRTVQPLTRS